MRKIPVTQAPTATTAGIPADGRLSRQHKREPVCFIKENANVSKGELQGLCSFSWDPPVLLPLPPVGTSHTKERGALN